MKKGRFGLILLWVSLAGTVLLIATALQASKHGIFGQDGTQSHVLLALIATLMIFFCRAWVVLYLLSLGRELGQLRRGEEASPPDLVASSRGPEAVGLGTFAWSIGALAALFALFFLGPATLLGRVPDWAHHGAFYLATLLHLVALAVERRSLRAQEANLARWEQARS